jgi:hypothetical protein
MLALLCNFGAVYAKGTYQAPSEFIQQAFNGQPPSSSIIWIKGKLREQIEDILQHSFDSKRVRYWQQGERSVWVLDEIGKKKPITVGIVIDDDKISQLKVLVFRETRGWEVRYPFFSDQFHNVTLTEQHQLSQSIDSISGATLSIRALKKLARIALLLNRTIKPI